MQKLLTILFMIYFFSTCAVLYCINLVICAITAPFDKRRRLVHRFSCWWGYHYFDINPWWRVDYQGLDNIDDNKTYVLISNHQSLADILAMYGTYKYFKWVSKSEVAKCPFVGWNMYLNQYVFLERGDMKSIKHMMQACKEWLNKNVSIMIFPEGTRSADGRLHAFRDGAFKLALDCDVHLVPIVIDGTLGCLPKGSSSLNFKNDIFVRVLPPINPHDFKGHPGKMRSHVHQLMAETLADMRGVPVSDVIAPKGSAEQSDHNREAQHVP
jgi:1-acyl-sn-glycerol-3-phosphate acyltransferase